MAKGLRQRGALCYEEELETKVSHGESHSCLQDPVPVKLRTARLWGASLVGNIPRIVSYIIARRDRHCSHHSTWREKWVSPSPTYVTLPSVNVHLCPFAVIIQNGRYNGFSEF